MSETKSCPFCSEEILAVARKCRHCGEFLDERLARRSRVRWEGEHVAIPRDAKLADDRCLLCAGEDDVRRVNKTFQHCSPLVYIGLLGGVLPLLVLYLIFRKVHTLALPLCAACARRWTLATVTMYLTAILGLFAFPFLGAAIGVIVDRRDGAPFGAILGFLGWFVALIVVQLALVGRSQAACKRIDAELVVLAVPDSSATRRALEGAARD